MKYFKIIFLIILYTSFFNNLTGQDTQTNTIDSLYAANTAILINHLRNNFDDIHDVSMRFHHMDHTLNGIIVLGMHWENGRLASYSVERNDTGNQNFPIEIAKNIKNWYIEDLTGPFDISLPLNIKIVGSNDSTFSDKGIFTGKLVDENGNPISGVKLEFYSSNTQPDTLRSIFSNREGIFVKTLIPVGDWNIVFEKDGYKPLKLENINFKKGEHKRDTITLVVSL